jgi:predicted nuclease of predicted toxin-antitoxin system
VAEAVKYYTDEHVARAVARGLRERGVDVLMAADAGMLSASDREHLEFALREGRVVFTQDDDFLRLHAAGAEHAGIAYMPQGSSIGEMIRGLMLVFQVLDADEMRNHVEFL